MKIIVGILDSDNNYLQRITQAFGRKYSDKVEICAFNELDAALREVKDRKIPVFLVGSDFRENVISVQLSTIVVYLTETRDVESVNGVCAIGKYQKIDDIYRQILNIYAEYNQNITYKVKGANQSKCIAFMSPSGGVGCSTVAASAATYLANHEKKVLYMNMDIYGIVECFFTAENQMDFGSIVYELKKGNTNIQLKLESIVNHDQNGVYFFRQPKVALDMMELTDDNIKALIHILKYDTDYEYIVFDMSFEMKKESYPKFKDIDQIILVGDGSEISNKKIVRAQNVYRILDQDSDNPLGDKIALIYNRFGNGAGRTLEGIKIYGGIPVIKSEKTSRIVERIASMELFKCLL